MRKEGLVHASEYRTFRATGNRKT